MAGHIVQHLGYVLSELRHAGTTVGTDTSRIGLRLMDDLLPRQVVGWSPLLICARRSTLPSAWLALNSTRRGPHEPRLSIVVPR
jgi:hypothetical protein